MYIDALYTTLGLLIQARMRLGMAWPEYSDTSDGSTWYLTWQSEAETNFKLRKTDGFGWYFWFLVRTAIYGYVVYHVLRFLKRKVPRILGFGPLRKNPNFRKLRRVVNFFLKIIHGLGISNNLKILFPSHSHLCGSVGILNHAICV